MPRLPSFFWTAAMTACASASDPAAPSVPEASSPGTESGHVVLTDSDSVCISAGGKMRRVPSDARRPPVRERICMVDSPKNGTACSDTSECAGGRCLCTGDLSGPGAATRHPELDGTAQRGICSDALLLPGDWYCIVGLGHAGVHGIILD
jgi:hypothetical protein